MSRKMLPAKQPLAKGDRRQASDLVADIWLRVGGYSILDAGFNSAESIAHGA